MISRANTWSTLLACITFSTPLLADETFNVDGVSVTFDVAPEVTEGYDRDDWK